MTDIKAQATGLWSATGTWSGGVVPSTGDVAHSNGFTVTINQDISVKALTKAANAGITASAGGQFRVSSGAINITVADGVDARVHNQTNSSNVLDFQHSAGTVTVNGAITGGNAGTVRQALACTSGSGGTLVINGDVTGGTTSGSAGIGSSSVAFTVVINGNVTGASAASAMTPSGWTSLTVNGDVTASTFSAIAAGSAIPMFINGDITPAAAAAIDGTASKQTVRAPRGASTYPDGADVRSGTTYGTISEFTGTLAVPPAASVASGVPVDATVGSAALNLSDVLAGTGAQIAAATSG